MVGHIIVYCLNSVFIVSAEAGLHHRVLSPPAHEIFHYDRTVLAEVVELTQ